MDPEVTLSVTSEATVSVALKYKLKYKDIYKENRGSAHFFCRGGPVCLPS